MTGVAGARKGAAKERSSSLHLCRRERKREQEREPGRRSLTDGPPLVPAFQIGDATSRLGNRCKEPVIHRELARLPAYDERARDFAESNVTGRVSPPPSSSFLLPLLFRHLTRKFGIEGAANRSLYSNRSNTAAFRMSSERSLRHSPRNPYKDSRRIDRLL